MYWKMVKVLSGAIATGAMISALTHHALAENSPNVQNNTSVTQIKTVTVQTAPLSRINQPTVLTERQTADDIRNKQVDDIHDVSRLDPVISYNSRNDSFTIRGLDQNRILTQIDGIRIPWLDDGARGINGGISTFDFNTLSTFDIIKGADSSLYGSGALGGVVAMRTLDPEDLLTNEKNWGAITKGSYDSANASWHINQAFAVRANQTSMLFQGGYVTGKQRRNNGYGGGYGPDRILENPADFDQNNLLFKIYQHVDGGHRFGFTAERFDYSNDVKELNISTSTYRPGSATSEQEKRRERLSLSYDYNGQEGILDEAHAVFYWQRQRLEDKKESWRLTTPKGDYMRNNSMRDSTYGLAASGLKELHWHDVSHTIRFSTDLASSKFNQYGAGRDNCPPPPYFGPTMGCAFLHTNQSDAPDTESNSFGFAIEDQIGFADNRFRLTPGGRFDWYEHKPKTTYTYEIGSGFKGYPRSNDASRFSPKLRAEFDATDQITFYAQWAQGFRAPAVTELYLNYTNPGFYYVAGNANLKPETSNGYDIGAQLGDDRLGGAISVFTNHYKNFIDTEELGPSREFLLSRSRYINRNRVRISGVEAKGHWKLNNGWHTNFALAYTEGKDTQKEEYLNSVPAIKGVVGIGYEQETWGSDLTMTAVGKRNKVEKNADYAKAPGYTVFDLTGWWQPVGEKGPRLQAGIYNLFDKRYWNAVDLKNSSFHKDYFSEPGRSFKVSFVQKF